jgi:CRP-like cAMP-binding protein
LKTRRHKPTDRRKRVGQSNERTNAAGNRVYNKILLSISDDEHGLISPHLKFLTLPHNLSLHEPNQPIEFVYFPNAGMVSLVVAMEDGSTVEVGEVGKEGFAGIPVLLGVSRSPVRMIVQISGGGFRVRASALQDVLRSTPELRLIMSRYAVFQGMCIAQTAACNRLHNIEQRLARWLLITQDRVESPTFAITHDFLATMLGTDRPTLSNAAGILREKHAITYAGGVIKILSRAKLENRTCECYGALQQYHPSGQDR